MINVICKCGKAIKEVNISYRNNCNEFGEYWYQGEALCDCGEQWEWIKWGECENIEQSKEDLQSIINGS